MYSSHIRIEHLHATGKIERIDRLLNYTLKMTLPELECSTNKPLALIEALMQKQIDLIVSWMRVGFVHGVMVDNITLSGETIDYGPCAFMTIIT